MEPTPLVSVVTPSYNQAQYLEQTVQSVLGQDYPRLEYLIVDGGSQDDSLEIIKKYADRLAWWVSEKDSGQAEAINKGLTRARGEIVAWLNSDDLYQPGTIAAVVKVFQDNPRVGLVFGDVLAIDETGRTINLLKYGNWGLLDLMSFRIIGQPSVFMRRSILEQAGPLDTSLHCLLDHHLWIRMVQVADILYIQKPFSSARYHKTAKNIAQPVRFSQEAYRILEWMKLQPNLVPLMEQNKKRIYAGLHSLSAFYLIDGGQPAAALKEYWRGFWLHPVTILAAWRRVLLALLDLFGLKHIRGVYLRLRRAFKSA
jgi:glycosyltransferase involved in cell wall biosynthesis